MPNITIDVLLAGYDAGHHGLPPATLAARAAVARLDAAGPPEPVHPLSARDQHVAAIVEAALAGQEPPANVVYFRAVKQHAEWTEGGRIRHEALMLARERLNAAAVQRLFDDYLAPALSELQAAVADLAAKLPAGASDVMLAGVGVTASARAAWAELGRLGQRYTALRASQHAAEPGRPAGDGGEWGALGNLAEVWPEFVRAGGPFGSKPTWPEDVRAFLLWCHAVGAELVMLSRSERERRFAEKYTHVNAGVQQAHNLARSVAGPQQSSGAILM